MFWLPFRVQELKYPCKMSKLDKLQKQIDFEKNRIFLKLFLFENFSLHTQLSTPSDADRV